MRCPFATWDPVDVSGHANITPNTLIFHSVAGSAQSAVNYFKSGNTPLQSHFVLFPDGGLVQLVDTNVAAYANVQANWYAISVETGNVRPDGATDEGFAKDLWTDAMLDSMVRLSHWANSAHGVLLRVSPSAEGGGVGYHNLYPEWSQVNGGGTDCPGAARVKQFNNVFVPRLTGAKQEGFSIVDAETKKYLDNQFASIRKDMEDRINGLRVEQAKEATRVVKEVNGHGDQLALGSSRTILDAVEKKPAG